MTAPAAAPVRPSPVRYLVLVGAVMIQLILGTVYGYSIFWAPLQAAVYPPILTQVEADAKVAAGEAVTDFTVVADAAAARVLRDQRQGYLKYSFSICILSFALVMVVAGRVQDVLGPRIPALIGGVLMALGFFLAGVMNHKVVLLVCHAGLCALIALLLISVAGLFRKRLDPQGAQNGLSVSLAVAVLVTVAGVLVGEQYVGRLAEFDRVALLWGTIGFLAGAGIGFAYVCPIAALVKWFPTAKGLVSGIAVAGFGFGAYIFKDPTIGAPPFFKAHGIASFFLVHALVCLVVVSLGALLLRNPPGTPPKFATESSWQETLTRPAFYVLWLMFFSGALAGLMVISIIAEFAKEQLIAAAGGAALTSEQLSALAAKGAAAVGWLAIFNAVGRVFWGLVSDRIGRTITFVVMFLFQAGMMFMLATMNTELSLAVAASIVGFNFGGNFALFPSATADLFGAKNLGANYGWVFTSYGIAGVMGVAAGNTAKLITGSYTAAFQLAAGLCVLSAVLAIGLAIAHRKARPA